MSLKPQVYEDPRPAEHFTPFHERTRKGHAGWTYDLVRAVLTPYLLLFFRARCIDSDKVPVEGPLIIAPNHFSFLDHFFVAVYLRRKVHFMAKSQLFKRPMQFIYTHGGVFPIQRGKRDEEAFKTAHAILSRGDIIVMYAEGGRSRSGELGDPKPGVGRLALESGAPVVPTAIFGSQGARNWKKGQFPPVTVQYGEPIAFEQVDSPSREQAQAASQIVFDEIKELYDGLRRSGRREAVRRSRRARRQAGAGGHRAATG